MSKRITVLKGDGVGPEVIEEAIKTLNAIESVYTELKFEFDYQLFGGISIDENGVPMTEETKKACLDCDAILLGAIGGPKWGAGEVRPEQGLLALRKALGVWANIRPCSIMSKSLLEKSPLRADIAENTSFTVLRELIGGIYFGDRQEASEDNGLAAQDTMPYQKAEIERVAHMSAFLAKLESDPAARRVISVDKANVLATSRLWRKTFTEVFEKYYKDIPLEHQLVDSAAMRMVCNPRSLNGIVATENLFGDILSDESSALVGSLGLLPSASLAEIPNKSKDAAKSIPGLFEPIHGSAPDIAGQQKANPIGTILSAALMLKWTFDHQEAASLIEDAVKHVLDSGVLTPDLGGKATTKQVGDAVADYILQKSGVKNRKV